MLQIVERDLAKQKRLLGSVWKKNHQTASGGVMFFVFFMILWVGFWLIFRLVWFVVVGFWMGVLVGLGLF